jgi:hypothetical protein
MGIFTRTQKPSLVDTLSVTAADKSPLLRAQKETYLDTKAKGDKYNGIAQYMFWGATSILFAGMTAIVGAATGGTLSALIGSSLLGVSMPIVLGVGAAAAIALTAGNMYFSSKGREYSEKAQVLYSDIDAQQQAHRTVQAFAKAQAHGHVNQTGTPHGNWVERTASGKAAQQQSWADRVAAEAALEEAAVLEVAGRG